MKGMMMMPFTGGDACCKMTITLKEGKANNNTMTQVTILFCCCRRHHLHCVPATPSLTLSHCAPLQQEGAVRGAASVGYLHSMSPRNPMSDTILLAACSANELLPQNPELPADVFTACLTTPIKVT